LILAVGQVAAILMHDPVGQAVFLAAAIVILTRAD
jgi:hypothetical protein